MTQPTFVPIAEADQVRPARHLHVPGSWTQSRPAEVVGPVHPRRPAMGTPGPDSGFALRLANRFGHELKVGRASRSTTSCSAWRSLAAKRSALFGRAPSIYDVQFALNLWGFLDDAPPELVASRRMMFSSISHDYVAQRQLVDSDRQRRSSG